MSGKFPININSKIFKNNSDNNIDFFFSLQDNIKFFLSILVIFNFMIIFFVKFLTNVNKKINEFFKKDEETKKSIENKSELLSNIDQKSNINEDQNVKTTAENKNDIKSSYNKKDVLLIIAHPDDEVVFFSPTLKYLTSRMSIDNYKVRILCLSNGNYNNIGKIREDEFSKVMKKLNITKYTMLNDEKLKDDLYSYWDSDYVCEKINEYLSLDYDDGFKNIGCIITFDENGVTNHPNHISCYNGVE